MAAFSLLAVVGLVCLCLEPCLLLASKAEVPVGHLQKLGSHRPMEGRVEELDYVPNPIDFYEQYNVPGKPVILKGAARDMPSFKLWSDSYMKEKYGSLNVAVEPGKKENRTRVALDGSSMNFGEFIDRYNESDVYMVDDVPETMAGEMMLLKCLLCGGYTKYLSMSNMWFSSGGTKSVLHNDDGENINCVLSGNKEFFMADRKYEEVLPFTAAGHVPVDVDAVDLIKTPEMKKVKWWLAEVEAGDCLFIPHYWLHQVRSTGRNLAVNIWWHYFRNFNHTDCLTAPAEEGADSPPRKELPQYEPFSAYEKHEGESHRKRYIEIMYAYGTGPNNPRKLSRREVARICLQEESPTKEDRENAKRCAQVLFEVGDKNGDKKLDVDEMYAIDHEIFFELFGEPQGGYDIDDVEKMSKSPQQEDAEEELERLRQQDDEGDDQAGEEEGEGSEDDSPTEELLEVAEAEGPHDEL